MIIEIRNTNTQEMIRVESGFADNGALFVQTQGWFSPRMSGLTPERKTPRTRVCNDKAEQLAVLHAEAAAAVKDLIGDQL